MKISGYVASGRLLASIVMALTVLTGSATPQGTPTTGQSMVCKGDNGGLSLSPGFCASIFADNLGHVRHLVVAANGTVYANTWDNTLYFQNSPAPPGGFLVALRDTKGGGKADVVQRFGVTVKEGGSGGTGIAHYKDGLFAEENGRILRYKLPSGSLLPSGQPQIVVSGLPVTGDHPMHPFIIDAKGSLFVDLGAATNACQKQNRMPGEPGIVPCAEKATRAGIWRFDANKTGQIFSPSNRYASGIRNGEGFAFDTAGRLFVTQHGRDQLFQNWPRLYTAKQSAELPAEELLQVIAGADYGWPECYYDQYQKRLVLSPEYGGDGGKKVGACAQKRGPIAFFPGHWAPDDLDIYKGSKFPAGYRGGAFIVFHGSWNRAPLPQGGYNVVFQPLRNGKASGPFVIFADGFAGADMDPGKANFRPAGLAEGPDGALYVADDVHGRIWRITYNGNGSDKVASAAPTIPAKDNHAGAGQSSRPLPTPIGATTDQVELGDRIFHGKVSSGTCSGCHGSDGDGTPQGPSLNTGQWLWSNGSLAGLRATIKNGVPNPKRYQGAMPPLGGAPLSPQDLAAVSAYVWAVGHRSKN